jgi:type I restriction enzyme R subunit
MFSTNFTTKDSQSFYNYYQDIAKRVRQKEIDILLVVNMFLTGFDSPRLNTLYVDKNLKYHGLIQAFSRTNRILNEKKSQGNIVCFRNLKSATDAAVALFSNKDAKQLIIMESYESYVSQFTDKLHKLLQITPTLASVDQLATEEEQLQFVQAFREVLRLHNILSSFADYDFSGFPISLQEFEDFKSKYLDLHDIARHQKEKVSILNDVDFELELIGRDEITVSYILNLLAKHKALPTPNFHSTISQLLSNSIHLRSKKALIEEFINAYLDTIPFASSIEDEFYTFREEKKKAALEKLIADEALLPDKVQSLLEKYLFTAKLPLREDIADTLITKPTILQRKTVIERVSEKLKQFIEIFIDEM